MIEFIAQNMAPIMFVSLIVFLLLGYPVAFALAANGLVFFIIGVELAPYSDSINLSWPLLNALPERFWGVMSNDTLLAIPFFTFMGIVLERSGMAEDLLDTIGQLFGPIRGGLAYAVIFVGALLAATTGVVAASVIAMGLISLPIMLRYGYDRRVASGVIAASGTLAQIIPPSLVLIVLADQLGRSVGDMYAGALIPGMILTGMYMGYILLMSFIRRDSMPALPLEARTLGHGVTSLFVALLVAVGIAYAAHVYLSPAHGDNADILGATVGIAFIYVVAHHRSRDEDQHDVATGPAGNHRPDPAAGADLPGSRHDLPRHRHADRRRRHGRCRRLIMAAAKGRLNMDVVKQALASTTRLSSFVLFILIGARVFSLTFYGVNGHVWVEHLLTSMPGGETGFLIAVNLLVFFLAFFLDFFELAFIIVPLLAPAADKLGIDLIWFGVLLGINMQTSFMHPPFGFALFYLRSVAAKVPYLDKVTGKNMQPVTTGQIYWGAVPFVGIQIIMVALTIMFPQMVMHYKDTGTGIDPNTIKIEVPGFGAGNATPGLGLPDNGGGLGLPGGLQLPAGNPLDAAPADGAGQQPETKPANDLTAPPSFN